MPESMASIGVGILAVHMADTDGAYRAQTADAVLLRMPTLTR
jgi:hypothetical protein